jgi:hypothetical protein
MFREVMVEDMSDTKAAEKPILFRLLSAATDTLGSLKGGNTTEFAMADVTVVPYEEYAAGAEDVTYPEGTEAANVHRAARIRNAIKKDPTRRAVLETMYGPKLVALAVDERNAG